MRKLEWSPGDSLYHCEFDGEFRVVQTILDAIWREVDDDSEEEYMSACDGIKNTCAEVLASIRDSGIFDTDRVVFNVLTGDEDNESRLLNAEALNSVHVLGWYRRELEIEP